MAHRSGRVSLAPVPGPLIFRADPGKGISLLEPSGKHKENMGLDSREAKGLYTHESPQPSHALSPATCRPCPSLLFKGHHHSPERALVFLMMSVHK